MDTLRSTDVQRHEKQMSVPTNEKKMETGENTRNSQNKRKLQTNKPRLFFKLLAK
jgi:hypothetical protein